MPLKYLFTAIFADGSVIEQDAADKSEIEPDKRSRFFDVLEKAKTTKLVRFELVEAVPVHSDVPHAHRYAVDLTDGHFEVDGVPFFMHNGDASDFRIVFWREHTHNAIVGVRGIQAESHRVSYKLGWQSNQSGKEHERVMRIA